MRSIAHQMKSARFPVHRDLAGFDFGTSQVDEALVGKLPDGKKGLRGGSEWPARTGWQLLDPLVRRTTGRVANHFK